MENKKKKKKKIMYNKYYKDIYNPIKSLMKFSLNGLNYLIAKKLFFESVKNKK
jgi:hypothetical protein